MKILFLAHRFPYPPNRGDKIRAFNVIRHMTEARGDQVTVASMVRTREEGTAAEGIREHCEDIILERVHQPMAVLRMLKRLPTKEPSSMGFFYSPRLAERIEARVRSTRFDLIFVFCSSVAQYVRHVDNVPKILDFADMDSQKWLAYGQESRFPLAAGYFLEGLKLQLEEAALARDFDCATVTTPAELRTLKGLNAGTYTDWFPNGVDTEYFSPPPEGPDADSICFVGRMDYFPNQQAMQWFADAVLPLIQQDRPNATLTIVGAEPSRAVRQLGTRRGIVVTGSVPDVRPYLGRATVSIAPLSIARGTQNKILEAMAMGVPTVASRISAGGVDATVGEHILAATKPEEYADEILGVLQDPERRRALSIAARARMCSHHSWPAAMGRLDAIIDRCVGNRSVASGA